VFCLFVVSASFFVSDSTLDAWRTHSAHNLLGSVIAEFGEIPGVQLSEQRAYESDATGVELARLGFRLSLMYLLVASAFIAIFATASTWIVLKRHNQEFINLYLGEDRPRLPNAKVVSAISFCIVFGSIGLILAIYGVLINSEVPRYRDFFVVCLVGMMIGYLGATALLVYLFNRR
jgi:hypothetical protein